MDFQAGASYHADMQLYRERRKLSVVSKRNLYAPADLDNSSDASSVKLAKKRKRKQFRDDKRAERKKEKTYGDDPFAHYLQTEKYQ